MLTVGLFYAHIVVIGTGITDMEKFNHIIAALNAGAKVVVGLNTYNGAADVSKFVAKYENETGDKGMLVYAQTRIFAKGVKYVTRARFGC